MRLFAAVALTCVTSAVKTRMWGIDLAPKSTGTSTSKNTAWIPSGNDFDFGSIFGSNSDDVWKTTTDKVSTDTKVDNSPWTTTTPTTGHVQDADNYFGNVFGQGFQDAFNTADQGTTTNSASALPPMQNYDPY